MELYSYSNEDLEKELERRKNLENSRTIYFMFYKSIRVEKLSPNDKIFYLIPKSRGREGYLDEKSRIEYNLTNLKDFKNKGYKIVILCPIFQEEYNKILFYYANNVIIF